MASAYDKKIKRNLERYAKRVEELKQMGYSAENAALIARQEITTPSLIAYITDGTVTKKPVGPNSRPFHIEE